MTQQIIHVTPNVVTTVNVQLAVGATLYNTDTVNAVWVANNPGVSPTSGIRIGPLGSLQWTTDKAPCYACLDTGVNVAVPITVSTDTANPVNPADVATATATALLNQGIPNVLTGEMIYGDQLPMSAVTYGDYCTVPITFADSGVYMNLSGYASVMLAIYVQTACLVTVEWSDVDAGGSIYTSQPYVMTHTGGAYLYIAQNVKSKNLNIRFSVTQASNPYLFMFASNRVLSDGVTQYDAGYNSTIPNRVWGVTEQVNFSGKFESKGGLHGIRLSSSFGLAVCKGFFGYRYVDAQGVSFVNFITSTHAAVAGPNAETEIFANVILPPGVLTLLWQNSTTGNTYEIKATITAGG